MSLSEVFAAHEARGWGFHNQTSSKSGSSKLRVVPPGHLPAQISDELAQRAHAYGVQTAENACRLWGVTGCRPDHASAAAAVQLPLWQLMGTLSAARLAVSALESFGWTAAALEALNLLVVDLEKGFKSKGPWRHGFGGREAERLLQSLQALLEGAQGQLRLSAKTGNPALTAESAVLVIARLDEAYYALLEHHLSCGHETPAVPPPHRYLPVIVAANPGNAAACKRLVRERAASVGKHLLRKVWGVRKVAGQLALPDQAIKDNPLLAVMWARFQEGCRLLYAAGLSANGEMDAAAAAEDDRISIRAVGPARPGSRKRPRPAQSEEHDSSSADDSSSSSDASEEAQSGDESLVVSSADDDDISGELAPAWQNGAAGPGEAPWPAHRALREWRQSGRECHLYAYAPYTREAMDALAERAPLVEVGAGLGYWAAALRARRVPVLALDSHPPGGVASNSYHGRIPAFTKVAQGGSKAAAAASERHTLFLCYPPPASSMAADCLRSFRGQCVCVVGEWLGDTGDESFAAALLADWTLIRRVPLPNWTDTAHELTIWQRLPAKSSGGSWAKKERKKARHARNLKIGHSDSKTANPEGASPAVHPPNREDSGRLCISSCRTCKAEQGSPNGSAGATGSRTPVTKADVVEEVTRENFVLPTLEPELDSIHRHLIFGRGIRLLRNLPLGLDVTLQCAPRAIPACKLC
ncbi:hypothetical protein WJX75_001738 [Coccomyxa subellipsoidea]|uniref:Uncharacterized protein n=1 Tax=Coccomyxa subellipsoidea TaxID=248742 RepID=A0ABR2YGZ2_9CHLO